MKTLALGFLAICALGCAASDAELDEDAVADGADGKADSVSFTRLERATPTQVATSFASVRGAELTVCFAAYRARIDADATEVTQAVADKFVDVSNATNQAACASWYDLQETVTGVLDMKGVASAPVDDINAAMFDWAKPQLTAASVGGYVETKDLRLLFFDDLMRVRDANARSREKQPTGVDLSAIRSQWRKVRTDVSLDRAYLNPVTFGAGALEGSQLFKSLRAAFPLRSLSLVSSGHEAVDDFATAHEGPDGDPDFAPIATALKKPSIKKRFYFARTGEWSSNVLIVIDQYNQVWGMQMGYSE